MGESYTHGWRISVDEHRWQAEGPDGRLHSSDSAWPGLLGMPGLFSAVLGLPVAEHHVLAAHGEGLFRGLSGHGRDWAARVGDLLEHLDRLRIIVEEWPQGHQMMSRTELKSRGWSEATISGLISPAAVLPNPHYASGGDMVLFDTRRVFELERTPQWFAASARLRHRRAFAAHDAAAARPIRAAALDVAARHPADNGTELALAAVDDASPAVRFLALDGLRRFWRGRTWQQEDLGDAGLAPVAALLGDAEVAAAALQHPDPTVVRVAVRRTLTALAG